MSYKTYEKVEGDKHDVIITEIHKTFGENDHYLTRDDGKQQGAYHGDEAAKEAANKMAGNAIKK